MKLPTRYSGAHRRRAGSAEPARPSGARLVFHEASEPASVVVEGLTVTFGEVTALHDVSCEAQAGAMLAVTGPSGAGKSTLLWAMAGALEPSRTSHGTVTLDEVPVVSRDQSARAGVTMIPQGSGLAAVLTAHENCLVPLLELGVAATEARQCVEAALDAVGLTDSGNHLIEELSGGQQQRVAVARALATRPRVLLADEPTSELDHANRERILDLIEALANDGCTVVMATHDPEAAARAPREIHLDEGRVAQRR